MNAAALPDPLPLFPLRTVLFPGGVLALKVFEARYVDLVGRCLRQDEGFGVVCLRQGAEVAAGAAAAVQFEEVGVLAQILSVDAAQPGILQLRCVGGTRFRLAAAATQAGDGLWSARALPLPADAPAVPLPAHAAAVRGLATAIARLREQGREPFAEPHALDDAGWVANRWCEILPIPLPARQQLMALPDALQRLDLVAQFLRDQGIAGA